MMRRALAAWILLVAALAIASPAAAEDVWAVRRGEAVFHFNLPLLHDLGIDLVVEAPSPGHDSRDGEVSLPDPRWAFPTRKGSDFRFRTQGGAVLEKGIP